MAREERTEKATPKKREDVRKKEGMVARSADLTSGAMFLFSVFLLRFLGPSLFRHFASLIEGGLAAAGEEVTAAAILGWVIMPVQAADDGALPAFQGCR